MAKERVFNIGDTVEIRSREYGQFGIVGTIEAHKKGKYPFEVRGDVPGAGSEMFELCSAEMKKISSGAELTVLEDWS